MHTRRFDVACAHSRVSARGASPRSRRTRPAQNVAQGERERGVGGVVHAPQGHPARTHHRYVPVVCLSCRHWQAGRQAGRRSCACPRVLPAGGCSTEGWVGGHCPAGGARAVRVCRARRRSAPPEPEGTTRTSLETRPREGTLPCLLAAPAGCSYSAAWQPNDADGCRVAQAISHSCGAAWMRGFLGVDF